MRSATRPGARNAAPRGPRSILIDRRDFVRILAIQAAAWSLGCGKREAARDGAGAGGAAGTGAATGAAAAAKPVRIPSNPFEGLWLGDDFDSGHRMRDAALLLGDVDRVAPAPAVDVVVVGGGISGLVAARALAKAGRVVRLVEQASALGGNAKSVRWGETEYAIGAAYFCRPDAGSELETLYREIGALDRGVKVKKGEALFDGKLLEGFWEGTLDPANAAATRRVRDEWRAIYEERYPAIPWVEGESAWTRAEYEAADAKPFARYLDEIGAPPLVRTFCEYYCWSSFGASAAEISTYAALNFITAEFGEILAMPGGNAGVAKLLADDLTARRVALHPMTIVLAVTRRAGGVEVVARRGQATLRFPCRACVIATPRFMSPYLIGNFPKERVTLIEQMKWRAYVVANILLAKRPAPVWYDAYRLDALDPKTCGWTDLILADYVASEKEGTAVLTAYRALPYDMGRAELILPESYAQHQAAVRRDIAKWLPALGLSASDVFDVNLARWGHPLVVAQPGQLSSGRLEALSAPLGAITFAHQDRYGVPAIETAIDAGLAAAREAQTLLV
ncbi:MAG: FAD-dependent oxidoreductase [bacterium]